MATEAEIKHVLDLLTIEAPHVESLALTNSRHVKSLRKTTSTDNVVAMGISEKIAGGRPTGELALTFYVEKKLPLSQLTNSMILPSSLSESMTGHSSMPTDVVEIGKIRLGAVAAGKGPNIKRGQIQPGYSIGHAMITAGTLGALVKKGRTKYFLSNSHVLANSGLGAQGDAILYPGVFDGGEHPDDVVATLHDFQPFNVGREHYNNYVDCAIAKPTSQALKKMTAFIKGIGLPRGATSAVRGMEVVKVGRTTDETYGKVKDLHFRVIIPYEGVGDVAFRDQVFCERYTDGGDSGALVLDNVTKYAVGLHFAAAEGGSIFNPIDKVLESLDVKLVTE